MGREGSAAFSEAQQQPRDAILLQNRHPQLQKYVFPQQHQHKQQQQYMYPQQPKPHQQQQQQKHISSPCDVPSQYQLPKGKFLIYQMPMGWQLFHNQISLKKENAGIYTISLAVSVSPSLCLKFLDIYVSTNIHLNKKGNTNAYTHMSYEYA